MPYIIKICGLTQARDAAFCARAGADWLGFIFHPQSPRNIAPEKAADFDTGPAKRVGVFVDQEPEEVLRIMEAARLNLAQLHGGQDNDFIRRLEALRTIVVQWPQKFARPEEMARSLDERPGADYFLFDAGQSGGGHGERLDLELITSVARPDRPWLLAGGLDASAIENLDFQGLPGFMGFDFNSALEDAPGLKNHDKVLAAIKAVRDKESQK